MFTTRRDTAEPYESDPGKFRELASNSYGPVDLFKVREPDPIVSVSNAPTVLVIGDSSHYEAFLRALSDSDIGSSRLVPIYGGEYADGLDQAELARYDTVFLYGALSHDPAHADRAAERLRATRRRSSTTRATREPLRRFLRRRVVCYRSPARC